MLYNIAERPLPASDEEDHKPVTRSTTPGRVRPVRRESGDVNSPGFGRVRGDDRVDPQLVGEILERLHGRRFHLVVVRHVWRLGGSGDRSERRKLDGCVKLARVRRKRPGRTADGS